MSIDVCVVGSINVDLVATVERLPSTGETVIGSHLATVAGGKGANQAVAAARQGARTAMVAATGDDAHANVGRAALTEARVDVRHVRTDPTEPTGVALIEVDAAGANRIVVIPGANGTLGRADIEAATATIGDSSWVVLQLEIPLPAVRATLAAARQAGTSTMLNAAPAQVLDEELLALVDVLVVNETELAALTGSSARSDDEIATAAGTLVSGGVGATVVTLGDRGLVHVDDREATWVEAFDVTPVDTVGAGDAFCGCLASALASGTDMPTALRRACAAGALATTVAGAVPSLPGRAAVDELLEDRT